MSSPPSILRPAARRHPVRVADAVRPLAVGPVRGRRGPAVAVRQPRLGSAHRPAVRQTPRHPHLPPQVRDSTRQRTFSPAGSLGRRGLPCPPPRTRRKSAGPPWWDFTFLPLLGDGENRVMAVVGVLSVVGEQGAGGAGAATGGSGGGAGRTRGVLHVRPAGRGERRGRAAGGGGASRGHRRDSGVGGGRTGQRQGNRGAGDPPPQPAAGAGVRRIELRRVAAVPDRRPACSARAGRAAGGRWARST